LPCFKRGFPPDGDFNPLKIWLGNLASTQVFSAIDFLLPKREATTSLRSEGGGEGSTKKQKQKKKPKKQQTKKNNIFPVGGREFFNRIASNGIEKDKRRQKEKHPQTI